MIDNLTAEQHARRPSDPRQREPVRRVWLPVPTPQQQDERRLELWRNWRDVPPRRREVA